MDIDDIRHSKRRNVIETILFFIVTYGVCWGVGILNYCNRFMSGDMMAVFMMTLPATGVSIAKLYGNIKNDENRRVHFVYVVCFICFVVFISFRIAGIISEKFLEIFINYILLPVSSILILIFAILDNGELAPGKNWKKVQLLLLIFIFLLIAGGIISSAGIEIAGFHFIAFLPVSYISCFLQGAAFFGEEYGWRGFLQEKVQKISGRQTGVILLGIIWELWHMPIWFSVYHVDGLGLALRFLSTGSFAVIIGYAYMKSDNVWVCAFMHYSINLCLTAFPGNADSYNFNAEHITGPRIAEVVFLFIAFSLFLCAKEYREEL